MLFLYQLLFSINDFMHKGEPQNVAEQNGRMNYRFKLHF